MILAITIFVNAFVAGYFYAAYKDTGKFMNFAFFFMNAFMTMFSIGIFATT